MALAKGTVSVVDSRGTLFSRIWCNYELYKSLIGDFGQEYTYDIVTATAYEVPNGHPEISYHGAVGITGGPL